MKFFQSIKFKLLCVCILLSLFLSLIFSSVFMKRIRNYYEKQQILSNSSKLTLAAKHIEQDIAQILRYANAFSENQRISNYLQKQKSDQTYASFMLDALTETSRLTKEMGIADYIVKGLLSSNSNGNHLIFGNMYGDIHDTIEFNQVLKDEPYDKILHLYENNFKYASISGYKNFIPYQTKIYSYNGSQVVGELNLAIRDTVIKKQFSSIDIIENNSIYIAMDKNVYRFTDNDFQFITNWDFYSFDRHYITENCFYTEPLSSSDSSRFIVAELDSTGWLLAQELPYHYFDIPDSEFVLYVLFVFAASILIAVLTYQVLNIFINKPVVQICNQINQIAEGNLNTEAKVLSSDEFSTISSSITNMANKLDALLKNSILHEKEKSNYKFQMLQSQINPHFLYNTLNSIRWMAEVQQAPGIVSLTSSLASMLRKLAESDNDFISVQSEIDFIKDYGTIQSYRYGNAFTINYHVKEEKLYHAQILKFTLQPLVENAIYHGIIPKGSPGTIDIIVYEDENKKGDLIVQVRDDGIGINKKGYNNINRSPNKKMNNHIGLKNIKERLVIEYGKTYGLTIDSKENEYTNIMIRIPLRY